ncbi:hypothetical protein V1511DRAFT_495248 [Dipodascopsis uninucleata]
MSKKRATKTEDSGSAKRPITVDPRFAGVHSDPRFARPKKKDTKVVLDKRFKTKIAEDEEFQQQKRVDRYGRKVSSDPLAKELQRYYLEEEDDEEIPKRRFDPARGEGLEDSSSDEEETDEEVDEEDVFESTVQEDIDNIPRGDETSSFAVVNMDWDNVRAEDLMVAFSGFVPKDGRIISLTIYPSEFGKERIAREEVEGPPREIFRQYVSDDEDNEEINEKTIIKEDTGEDFDSSKLRKYQLQRLRYYYAVVKCDSVKTARSIYNGCDGTEYESTANFFDLRYIPEGMEFDEKPKEVCTEVPTIYRPNVFVTDALQHSKVKLTWDATPNDRIQLSKRAFSRKEIEEMDFKAYLASDSDGSDFDDDENLSKEKLREKYRSLLSEKNETGFGTKHEEDDVDMEITFTPGLSENASNSEKIDGETTIENYRRKEKERKKLRLERAKERRAAIETEVTADKSEDDLNEDEFFSSVKNSKNKSKVKVKDRADKSRKLKGEEKEMENKKKAELELLMMDEESDSNLKHFNMKEIIKSEKRKKNKKIRSKNKNGDTDDFSIDVSDNRFSAVFENHEFAIDPTQPQFKQTNAMEKLMEERRRRQDFDFDES